MSPRRRERGFSLAELLVTAFIMAVGLLGLTVLQTMAVRSGGWARSQDTAIVIAGRILDAAAAEGRLSWNNLAAGSAAALPATVYLQTGGGTVTEYYGQSGNLLGAGGAAAAGTIFTAVTTSTPGLAVAAALGGRTTLVQVTVTFKDAPTHTRTVVLQRSLKSA